MEVLPAFNSEEKTDDTRHHHHRHQKVKMFTLSRGELAKFDETHVKKMQQLLLEKKIRDLESMILTAKLSQNFSGISYSVSFKTNKPIILWSIGFWGPFNETVGKYIVQVVLTQINDKFPSRTPSEIILEKVTTSVRCQWREIFTVDLPQATLLSSNKWIQIRFQLDGPETAICSCVKNYYSSTDYSTKDGGDSGVDFEFFDSSHQLPQLNFSLP